MWGVVYLFRGSSVLATKVGITKPNNERGLQRLLNYSDLCIVVTLKSSHLIITATYSGRL